MCARTSPLKLKYSIKRTARCQHAAIFYTDIKTRRPFPSNPVSTHILYSRYHHGSSPSASCQNRNALGADISRWITGAPASSAHDKGWHHSRRMCVEERKTHRLNLLVITCNGDPFMYNQAALEHVWFQKEGTSCFLPRTEWHEWSRDMRTVVAMTFVIAGLMLLCVNSENDKY